MPSASSFRKLRRPGLTLMELVVVLVVLVATAGIVVGLLPGMIGRAETSSRAANSSEIYKWLQTYEATYSNYGYDWDALIDSTGTAITYVSGFTGSAPPLAVTQLDSSGQAAALIAAFGSPVGASPAQSRLQLMTSTVTGVNQTFDPYPTSDKAANGLPITNGMNIVTLTSAGQAQLNLSDNPTSTSGTYVVVGFGPRATIVGRGVGDPPVNFYDNFALSPDTRYSRYGLVFQVAGYDNTGDANFVDFTRAMLVRVFRFGGSLGTGDQAISSYWQDVVTPGGS